MPRDPRYPPLFLEGIARFNREEFFESHEVWEDLWRDPGLTEPSFIQGLIQVAVSLHWLQRGNLRGARRLLSRAADHLAPYRPCRWGVDLDRLLRETQYAIDEGERRLEAMPGNVRRASCDPPLIYVKVPKLRVDETEQRPFFPTE